MHREHRNQVPTGFRWLAIGVALILALGGGFVQSLPAAAQEDNIVYRGESGKGTENGQGTDLQTFDFSFGPNTATPLAWYPETMIISVVSGAFGFFVDDDRSSTAIVMPATDRPVALLATDVQQEKDATVVKLGDPTGESLRTFDGTPCTRQYRCAVPLGTGVLLGRGDVLYVTGPAFCLVCNLLDQGQGVIKVSVIVPDGSTEFSWQQFAKGDGQESAFQDEQTEVATNGLRTYSATYLPSLNPGGCAGRTL